MDGAVALDGALGLEKLPWDWPGGPRPHGALGPMGPAAAAGVREAQFTLVCVRCAVGVREAQFTLVQ